MTTSDYTCETESIAAYIDGELDSGREAALEEHLKQCPSCATELQTQRIFMCELDSALASRFELAVPANFAQVVAAHAESDMHGVRDRAEHKRALGFLHYSWFGGIRVAGRRGEQSSSPQCTFNGRQGV